MKDCPLVVYGKKTTNDAKRGGLKLGLASYLPQKWWCQAPENISCQITGYFFLLQYPQWQMAWCFCLVKIFCLLLTLCTFLKVPNEIKSISAKQTHTLVSVKLERGIQAKVESTWGDEVREFSIKLGSELVRWLGLRVCLIGLLPTEWHTFKEIQEIIEWCRNEEKQNAGNKCQGEVFILICPIYFGLANQWA